MREILFRGKRVDNGEFVEGFYHFSHWYLPPSMKLVDTHYYILPIGGGDAFQIDPETVGQFTGLTDKNGKKIFEGDIVEVNHDAYPGARGEVFFRNGSFMLKKVSDILSLYGFLLWCEVIGNIHDNPELLEG